jgi:hypothetical protein
MRRSAAPAPLSREHQHALDAALRLRRADASSVAAAVEHFLADGRSDVTVGGQPMDPRLHLTIHEIVAAQVIDGDPPEVLATARRLVELGRDHHEVLHVLGSVVAEHEHEGANA